MDMSEETFEIRILTLRVTGRLDAMGAVGLRDRLDTAIEDGINRIVVDLSSTEFVDSAGLAALAKGMKDARAEGGDLRLVSPRSDIALRVFQLTRFDQVFEMGQSVDSLIEAW